MPSGSVGLLGDLEGEALSRPSLMRFSYDFSAVVPDSRRIKYGGESCVSD